MAVRSLEEDPGSDHIRLEEGCRSFDRPVHMTLCGEVDDNVVSGHYPVDEVTVSTAPNAVPVADDQSVSTQEDTPVDIILGGTDPDGDDLTYSVASEPLNGSLSGTAPELIYTPSSGYIGSDSFTFSVS